MARPGPEEALVAGQLDEAVQVVVAQGGAELLLVGGAHLGGAASAVEAAEQERLLGAELEELAGVRILDDLPAVGAGGARISSGRRGGGMRLGSGMGQFRWVRGGSPGRRAAGRRPRRTPRPPARGRLVVGGGDPAVHRRAVHALHQQRPPQPGVALGSRRTAGSPSADGAGRTPRRTPPIRMW